MLGTLPQILAWLTHYRYELLLPIAVIEGPIATVLAGFLSSLNVLNFWEALFIVVLGDYIGDTGFYLIGRWGRERVVLKYGRWLRVTPEHVAKLDQQFKRHPKKTLVFGKFAHSVGFIVLLSAGIAKIDYWEFVVVNVLATIPKSLLLLTIGYYFGHSYTKINGYLNIGTIVSFIIVVSAIVLYVTLTRRARKKIIAQDQE